MKIVSSLLTLGMIVLVSGAVRRVSESPSEVHHTVITGTTPYDSVRAILSGYRWPTEEFLTVTSSFADFRSTHFHGGIDISTHRKKGYRVFASKAGYVAHISISPYGYGKLLLVEHPDGYRTAYAHLSRFNDTLEAYVQTLQHQQDQYPLEANLELNQFPVSQGDVIAYTGDTGIGVAHLHFEIHDEQFNPVNPLLVPEFSHYIKDSTPPEIRKIAFVPLDPSSRVNDRQTMLVINASRVNNKEYRFTNVIHCTGRVGVELYAVDHSDDTWYRSTATDFELYVDSTFTWSSRITRVLLNETKQIALHFDWGMYKARRGYFQKLYVEPGDDQPFYGGDDSSRFGLRTDQFGEGRHTLRIVVSDVFGNRSEMSGSVIFNHPPSVEIVRDSAQTALRVERPCLLKSITFTSIAGKPWAPTAYAASQLAISDNVYSLPVTIRQKSIYRIQAENVYGTKSSPVFLVADTSSPRNVTFRYRKQLRRDHIAMTVWTNKILPRVPLMEASTTGGTKVIGLQQTDPYRYEGIYVPSPADQGLIQVSAAVDSISGPKHRLDEFAVFPVTPEGGVVSGGNGAFQLRFGEKGVYRYTIFQVEQKSGGYSVKPADVLLDRGAVVQWTLPRIYPGKVGLFSGKDIIDWTEANQKSALKGRVDQFVGTFSLLEDNDPPEVSRLSAFYSRGKVRVSFRLFDFVAGIDPNAIKIRIDNDVMIGEFDPYARYVRSEEYHSLVEGTHVLTIEVSDRMANKKVIQRTLVVSR
jgi:hypothetical protein